MKLVWKQLPEVCSEITADLLQIAIYDLHTPIEKCIIILDKDPQPFFEKLAPVTRFCKKHKLPLPLIVTRDFIRYSLDSYPLEFINIASDYINVFDKEDLLKDLEYDMRDIRLQMEREFKSKWLHTRLAILENAQNSKAVYAVIHRSLDAILPILKGLFFLHNESIPKTPEEVFQRSNEMTEFDITILKRVDEVSAKELSSEMIREYLEVLEQLTSMMELWVL
jgi:hypothetical protein